MVKMEWRSIFWLYGNKKNTDGMTLTHYLYGVDIPAFLNKIKEKMWG